jgi:hypothetical protein
MQTLDIITLSTSNTGILFWDIQIFQLFQINSFITLMKIIIRNESQMVEVTAILSKYFGINVDSGYLSLSKDV